jgi:hypothetical protein
LCGFGLVIELSFCGLQLIALHTRDIVGRYFEEKAKLKTFIKQQCERVCITTDAWTSQQQDSYSLHLKMTHV